MKRRDFLKSTGISVVAGGALWSCAREENSAMNAELPPKKIERFGVNLFSVPLLLEADFAGGLARMAEIGYKELEFYGPFPFSIQSAHDSWNSITPNLPFSGSGYFGHSVQEVKKIMDDHGLSAPSMHTDLGTLEENLDALAEASAIMGHKYAGIAAIPEELRTTLDGYRRVADRFNEIGMRLKKHGMQFLYHNHGYGLSEMEGEIPMHLILDRTEPEYVAMEMDIFWTTVGRADPVAYLESYPGRFKLMHIKDMQERVYFEGDGGTPDQWIALFPKMTEAVGTGILNIQEILGAALKSGVEHFYLERDMASDPEKTLTVSFENLNSFTF